MSFLKTYHKEITQEKQSTQLYIIVKKKRGTQMHSGRDWLNTSFNIMGCEKATKND